MVRKPPAWQICMQCLQTLYCRSQTRNYRQTKSNWHYVQWINNILFPPKIWFESYRETERFADTFVNRWRIVMSGLQWLVYCTFSSPMLLPLLLLLPGLILVTLLIINAKLGVADDCVRQWHGVSLCIICTLSTTSTTTTLQVLFIWPGDKGW